MFAMNNQRCLSLSIASEDCMSSTVFFAFNESQSYTDWEKTEDLFYFTAIQIYVHNLLPLWMELVRSHSRTLPISFSIIYIFMGLLHRIAIFCTIYRLSVRCCEFTSCVRLNERQGIDELSLNLIDVYKFSCCCWCCSYFFWWWGRNSYEDLRKFTLITILCFAFVYRYLLSKAK